jgi:hypothetical protein
LRANRTEFFSKFFLAHPGYKRQRPCHAFVVPDSGRTRLGRTRQAPAFTPARTHDNATSATDAPAPFFWQEFWPEPAACLREGSTSACRPCLAREQPDSGESALGNAGAPLCKSRPAATTRPCRGGWVMRCPSGHALLTVHFRVSGLNFCTSNCRAFGLQAGQGLSQAAGRKLGCYAHPCRA